MWAFSVISCNSDHDEPMDQHTDTNPSLEILKAEYLSLDFSLKEEISHQKKRLGCRKRRVKNGLSLVSLVIGNGAEPVKEIKGVDPFTFFQTSQ